MDEFFKKLFCYASSLDALGYRIKLYVPTIQICLHPYATGSLTLRFDVAYGISVSNSLLPPHLVFTKPWYCTTQEICGICICTCVLCIKVHAENLYVIYHITFVISLKSPGFEEIYYM